MRKIERLMLATITKKKSKSFDNTCVQYLCELDETMQSRIEHAKIFLHGHHIATYSYATDEMFHNPETLARYPTQTTKSRLRALGINVYTKNWVTYVDGRAVA